MEFIIRTGTDNDLPAVLKLIQGLAEFEKQPDAVTNTVKQMRKDREHFDFFVAEIDGEIAGMSIYYYTYSTWVGKSLYLEDLYVLPDYRNRGIGAALLRKTVAVAQDTGCNRMRWQVLDWNTEAQRLYRRLGADISTEWYNCDLNREGIEGF